MRALAICGSPRVEGNTEFLLRKVLDTLAGILGRSGIEIELVRMAETNVKPCIACSGCGKLKDGTCAVKDDDFNDLFEKIVAADIIVVGSPVHFGSATPQIMAVLNRAGYVSRANGNMLSRKLGGAVVVARRAGQNFTLAQLNYWFFINDMIVPGSTYWNIAFGLQRGTVETDTEGVATITRFAENLAWLAEKTRC